MYMKVRIHPNEILQYRAWTFSLCWDQCCWQIFIWSIIHFLVMMAILDAVPTYRMQLRMWTIQGYWCSLFSLVLYIMLHNWEFVKTTADNFKIHEFWQNNFHLKFIQTTIMLTDCIIATSRCCKSNNVRTQSN